MDRKEYSDPFDIEEAEFDLDEAELEERRTTLDADAVPPPVGVYDRPERQGMSPAMMLIFMVVLLVLLAVVLFVLF